MNDNSNTNIQFNNKIDIIIVGAGISGLSSALKIQQKEPSLKVRILEASHHIGGQLRSTHLGEIGAKWITEDQCHMYQLLNHLKVSTQKRSTIDSTLKRCWDIDNGLLAFIAKYELERYIQELDLGMEYMKADWEKFDKLPMLQHVRKRLFLTKSRTFMMDLILLITGVDANEINYNDFMNICYSCGGIKRLIDLLIEVPNTMLEFSTQDLLNNLLNQFQYIDILRGHKVVNITQYREHVEVRDSENVYHIADAVILAIPLSCVQDMILISPPLPIELLSPPTNIDNIKYVVTSFLASYTEPHWRNKGLSGQCLCHDPLFLTHEYRPNTISGSLIHEEGIEPLVSSVILHKLSEKIGQDMLIPRDFQQHTFQLNGLAHLPLTTPWNRIIWSSSAAAATFYRGRLSGAVQSGLRAAMNALLVTRPQVVTYQDISEIQCGSYLQRKDATRISQWLSTWNLYNVSTYTIFMCGVILALRYAYRNH